VGKAVVDPTHNSLLADYYGIESRARVFSFHRAANALGSFLGPLLAGIAGLPVRVALAVPALRRPHAGAGRARRAGPAPA
jgi:MFS family permease